MAVPFKINKTDEVSNFESLSSYTNWHEVVQIMKETSNIWEYQVGINAIIANFVCFWKCRTSQWSLFIMVKEEHAIQMTCLFTLYPTQEIYIPSDSQEISLQMYTDIFSLEVKMM